MLNIPLLPALAQPFIAPGSSAELTLSVCRDLKPATMLKAVRAVLATAALVQCQPVPAQSVSQEPTYGLSGSIGMSVARVPTYEGSPNDRAYLGPQVTLNYRTRDLGSVELGQNGVSWNATEAGRFRFVVVAQFDPGRKDRDTSLLNPTPGDKRLAGMGNVSSSTELGVGVGYGSVMLVARQSLSDRGPKGTQADLTVGIPWQVSDRFGLQLAVGATWANQDYLQAYYGVTAAQAQATSFPVYTPKSGCRKVDASITAEYALASSWKLLANVAVSQLGDDAAKSPLVGRRSGTSMALSIAHTF